MNCGFGAIMVEEELNLTGYVLASRYRRFILRELASSVNTPSGIASALDVRINKVSTGLRNLEKSGLIICSTPKNRKGRIYRITELGRRIDNIIKRIQMH